MMMSVFDKVENFVEKVENAGYRHFLLFPQCLPKLSVSGSLKLRIVWLRLTVMNLDYIYTGNEAR